MPVERKVELTGELRPYMQVALRSPVNGVVEKVVVDTGSRVAQGDLLADLSDRTEIRAPRGDGRALADPLFELQQNSRLRLVVPVAEEDSGSIPNGMVS